jgi:hypothetical protein
MRTPDVGRARARDLYALARSTPHADDGLVYVLRAMELEAGPRPPGRGAIPELNSNRRRHAGPHVPGAKRARRT